MIKYGATHHAGGFASSPYASSLSLTVKRINEAHKNRKDWIGYPAHLSTLGYYVGYNFVYDPKDRSITQTRAIGEETLAQKGFNFTGISICIIGNYSKITGQQITVDPITDQIEHDIAAFWHSIIKGNHNYVVAKGTNIDLVEERIHPHRWFQPGTECYGNGISDKWLTEALVKYRPKPMHIYPNYEEQMNLVIRLRTLIVQLKALLEKKRALEKMGLGSIHDKSCCGVVELVDLDH